MKFFFDESGNFQPPPPGEHRAGIVSGIAIPDSDEAEILQRFDAFVGALPTSAFKKGEPKGRLLDDDARKELANMIVDLPGILICPIMLDLTSLVGQSQANVARLVSQKLMQLQATCKHQTFRDQLVELANDVSDLSMQQALRLVAWAKCISRTIRDSIILHSGPEYEPSWNALRFEIDPVEQTPRNREERVFETMLPMVQGSGTFFLASYEGRETTESGKGGCPFLRPYAVGQKWCNAPHFELVGNSDRKTSSGSRARSIISFAAWSSTDTSAGTSPTIRSGRN